MFNAHFSKSLKNTLAVNILNKPKKKASKEKTGESKLSVPFRRTVFEYRHGLICNYCKKAAEVVSFSPKPPKYCGKKCRQRKVNDCAVQKYWQQKLEKKITDGFRTD
jgi:hypothetical protein